jgi:hypothetical protein
VRSKSSVSAILSFVFTLSAAVQQGSVDRFRFERPIDTGGAGPRRLAVDVPLLTGAEPYLGRSTGSGASGLADLRLFDQNGAPVPYILLQSGPRAAQWNDADVLPLARTDKTSGFETDFREARIIDAVRVLGLPAPFLKRLTLEGSGDREHWTLLSGEGTLFDLPDEGLRQTELRFSAGTFRYLRVTWDDRSSGRVPMPASVQARQVIGTMPPPPLTARVAAERRPSEPGRSRYRVKLPAPRLPIVAVDVLVTGSAHVFRQASMSESRLSGTSVQPAELGRARLTQVARDDMVAGAMRIPIAPPTEGEIDLIIEDGNNAPLDVSGVTIVFDELPWIYFEAPEGPVVARYGDPSAVRPTYDLEAVRAALHIESVKDARWGEARRMAARADSAPAASPMPETGSVVDADLFSFRRAIPGGPPGLVALVVDPDALAHSRGADAQFSDMRILDQSNRQVPYVVERRDEPLTVPLTLDRQEPKVPEAAATPGRTRSYYLIRLPYASPPSARIVFETSARVFQRGVELSVERPANRSHRAAWRDVIATTTWSHVDTDEAASALILPLERSDSTELWLSIDEGDNSALPITGVRLLLPSYRLRFYRPAGATLRLVYGRSDLAAPRYDLALLAPQVIGVEAQEVAAAPESATGGRTRAVFISQRAFWIFLSVAVLVLLVLIVRLARKEGGV